MPISRSAKKALRVNRRKTALNRYRKALVKDAIKNVDEKSVNTAVSMIDKAAKWKLIHKNKAARLKSQITKKFGTKPSRTTKTAKSKTTGKATAKKVTKKTTAKPKTKKS